MSWVFLLNFLIFRNKTTLFLINQGRYKGNCHHGLAKKETWKIQNSNIKIVCKSKNK